MKKRGCLKIKLRRPLLLLFQIEVIWIFLKKEVYKLTFEGFILSNCSFRCHKPPKRLLLQDYVQWPAGRTQFQPS